MQIDTLKVSSQMETSGMPRRQCEALAVALQNEIVAELVTSADLGAAVDRMETGRETAVIKLEAKIDRESARLDGRLSTVEARLQMMQWMVGLNLAATLGVLWKLLR